MLSLLSPIFPAFLWGPFTHTHINRKALNKAKKLLENGDNTINQDLVNMLTSSRETQESYALAANTADAISSYHTLNNFTAYDYTHNSIPDNARGLPNFGYTLVDTWCRIPESAWSSRETRLLDLAIACGWLSHQIADWYAHYACIDGDGNLCDPEDAIADEVTWFSGYSDSHRVIGHDYPVPYLRRYNLADHGLTEFLVDSIIVSSPKGPRLRNLSLPNLSTLRDSGSNIISVASLDFGGAVKLPEDHIPVLWQNMNLILLGMSILQKLIYLRKPNLHREAKELVTTKYVDLSIERVVDNVFRKSFGEIAELARCGRRIRSKDMPIEPLDSEIAKYPGTVIFKIAHSLASSISLPDGSISSSTFNRTLDVLDNPLVTLERAPVIGPLMRSRLARDILWSKVGRPSFETLITESLDSLGGSDKGVRMPTKDALLVLANGVLLKGRSIQKARQDLALSLKPVITVVDSNGAPLSSGRELPTQSELLDMVFKRRMLVFRLTPAISESRGACHAERKSLDISTVRVRFNGFPISQHPEFAEAEVAYENDSTASPVLVKISFRPGFRPGRYDIFVDARDRAGAGAEYLYWQVDLGR
jgi:hypothetical protein